MEDDDDLNVVFCNCRRRTFGVNGTVSTIHDDNCPFQRMPYHDAVSHWFLQQAVSNAARRRSSNLDDDVLNDEYPFQIPSSQLRDAIHEYRHRPAFLAVGYGRSLLTFSDGGTRIKKTLRGGVQFRISKINIIDSANSRISPATKLTDVMGSFGVVFLNIIKELKKVAKSGDKVQFVVYTEKTPAFDGDSGMSSPVTTPLIDISTLTETAIVPFLISNFHSYDHITIGDQIVVESVLIRSAANMTQSEINQLSTTAGNDEWFQQLDKLKKVKGLIRIRNDDNMCLARALVVAYFHEKMEQTKNSSEHRHFVDLFNSVRLANDGHHHHRQGEYAFSLCEFAKVTPFQMTTDNDILKFADYLKAQIKVVSSSNFQIVCSFGEHSRPLKLYLLQRTIRQNFDIMSPDCVTNQLLHYDAIVDIKTLKGFRHYCKFCDVGFSQIQSHKCRDISSWCNACFRRECQNVQMAALCCNVCGVKTRGSECMEKHHEIDICAIFICTKCHKRVPKKRKSNGSFEAYNDVKARHECEIKCHLCGRLKEKVHKCFMLRKPFHPKCSKFVFLDFETDQSSGEHIPICCYMNWVSFKTDDETGIETMSGDGEKFFGVHYLTGDQVGQFLFSKRFQGYTVLAHNMKGFDGCFLLRYLLKHNFKVSVIANGLKLTSIHVASLNMRLIDSLNFFQMPLAGLVEAMGLENDVQSKGYFPHFFTHPENITYKGELPHMSYYGCFDMKSSQHKKFLEWYVNAVRNEQFNFIRDIEKYCRQDVIILREGCLKFRKLLIECVNEIPPQTDVLCDEETVDRERVRKRMMQLFDPDYDDLFEGEIDESKSDKFDTEGSCDPFAHPTAPNMCGKIFQARFLKKNSIAQILPAGYSNFRHSQSGLEYLEFLKRTRYPDLQHAQNTQDGREVVLLQKYRVDGFVPSQKLVVEFNGCFWHGCSKCISNLQTIQPVRGLTYETLLNDTHERQRELEDAGYVVETMWECDWEKLKKECSNVQDIIKDIHIKSRLSPRDAFKGGRTETARMAWNIETCKYGVGVGYVDFTSLYPWTNLHCKYPVGHPIIITSDFGPLDSYFGLVQCSVLPPQKLEHGVLPVREQGRLMFPLCRRCVQTLQIDPCKHLENDRLLHGIWVSEELKQAVKYGYQIKQIYCVHHFERTSKELFSGYIQTFFKLKLAASKRPADETPEQLNQFISELKERDGIDILPSDFHDNPGLRNIAKLCCNSFWGRLGMRDSFTKTVFVFSMEHLYSLMEDPHSEITSIRYISDVCIAVLLRNKSIDTLSYTNNTNIYAAVFTTAYARIRLYDFMYLVKDRLLYVDTDSLMFILSPFPSENLPMGHHLGELTNELDPGEVIVRFVSGGPKVYAFITNKGRCVVKIKGFRLTQRNLAAFSFDNLEKVILTFIADNLDSSIGRVRNPEHSERRHEQLRKEMFEMFHGQSKHESGAAATSNAISVYNVNSILRTKSFNLMRNVEQKMYTYSFNKRIVRSDFSAVPYGFVD